jgi:hypothetical protein
MMNRQGGRMLNFIDRHFPLVFTAMTLAPVIWAMAVA